MSVAAFRDTISPRTFTPIGFGDPDVANSVIWFRRIFRDSGNNYTLPDWTANPRINTFELPGGGVYKQRNGYNPDTIDLRVELQTVADAASLRSMVGYLYTLILPDPPYSTRGTAKVVHGSVYRYITDVLLTATDASEGLTVRGNYPRVVLSFEMNRLA